MLRTSPFHDRLLHLLAGLLLLSCAFPTKASEPSDTVHFSHALSRYGEPALAAGEHFTYVNTDAPKGGILRQAQLGNFDTFNAYNGQGKVPYGLFYTHDTLLIRGWDEPLSKYGVLTKTIEWPESNDWVAFHLNPDARFHDGKPITADDVVFSFQTLTQQGGLFWQQFYQDVAKVEATSSQRVLFTFHHNRNKELPLTLGQLPVLASHWWQGRDFSQTTLDIPVGSGPYRISRFKSGQFVEYERVKDYWAQNHPLVKGRYNFDTIRFDIYRDNNVILEAMNSGLLDLRFENDARYWDSGYRQSALANRTLIKTRWLNSNPQTHTLVLNSRRPLLSDIRVREALAVLLDMEWPINHLYGGTMVRATSLFAGSELAATGEATGPEREQLTEALTAASIESTNRYAQSWPPLHNQSKRERRKYALTLLQQAGFTLRNNKLIAPSGQPVLLNLLLVDPALERLLQSQVQRFAEVGIQLNLQTMESARYLTHLRSLDFDMVVHVFRHTPSPGTEQNSFWGSVDRDQAGTLNLAGVNHPAIDWLLTQLPSTTSRAQQIPMMQALDRLLLWQFQVIPLAYQPDWMVVHSHRIMSPPTMPRYIVDRTVWWASPQQLAQEKQP